ncbi:MAG: hypothetical protein ACQEXJ_22355 [Myxococcota bacterium]
MIAWPVFLACFTAARYTRRPGAAALLAGALMWGAWTIIGWASPPVEFDADGLRGALLRLGQWLSWEHPDMVGRRDVTLSFLSGTLPPLGALGVLLTVASWPGRVEERTGRTWRVAPSHALWLGLAALATYAGPEATAALPMGVLYCWAVPPALRGWRLMAARPLVRCGLLLVPVVFVWAGLVDTLDPRHHRGRSPAGRPDGGLAVASARSLILVAAFLGIGLAHSTARAATECRRVIPPDRSEQVQALVGRLVDAMGDGVRVSSIHIERSRIEVELLIDGEACRVAVVPGECRTGGMQAVGRLASGVSCSEEQEDLQGGLTDILASELETIGSTTDPDDWPWIELEVQEKNGPATELPGMRLHPDWLALIVGRYALLLLILPLLLMITCRRHLPAVEARHATWFVGLLLAAAAWRYLAPAPGWLKETYHGRDVGGLNLTLAVTSLHDWAEGKGYDVSFESLLFATNGFVGWLTIALTFVATLAATGGSRMAVVAAAFVAFLPSHVRYSVSEALTVGQGCAWAGIFISAVCWLRARSLLGLVLAALLGVLVWTSRQEGPPFVLLALATALAIQFRSSRVEWLRGLLLVGVVVATASIGRPPTPLHAALDRLEIQQSLAAIPLTLHQWASALVSPDRNAFLDPGLSPLPYVLLLVVGVVAPVPRDLRRFRWTAIAAFVLMFFPYAMLSTTIRPLGEARYQVALVVPAAWLTALGVEAAWRRVRSLPAPYGFAWPRLRWLAIGLLLANHAVLIGVLRTADYDIPQEQEFLSKMSSSPATTDARILVHVEPLDNDNREWNRPPSLFVVLQRFDHGRAVEELTLAELREHARESGEFPPGVYYYQGVFCTLAPQRCRGLEAALELEPVATRVVPEAPFLSIAASHKVDVEGGIDVTFYRVVGFREASRRGDTAVQ